MQMVMDYWVQNIAPYMAEFACVLFTMVQSGKFLPGDDWICSRQSQNNMNLESCNAHMRLTTNPRDATWHDMSYVFFRAHIPTMVDVVRLEAHVEYGVALLQAASAARESTGEMVEEDDAIQMQMYEHGVYIEDGTTLNEDEAFIPDPVVVPVGYDIPSEYYDGFVVD
jgi:hypothetical protein